MSPAAALAAVLKVDQDALPPRLVQQIRAGQVNLNDPAVTLALLRLNAVVGLTGFFKSDGGLQSVGIQCALCHPTVDNAFALGIGHRLDGWANRQCGPLLRSQEDWHGSLELISLRFGASKEGFQIVTRNR